MSAGLYQQAIKDWARAAHGKGRLEAADGESMLDNPLCGDRVRLQVRLDRDGRIAALAHETRGCLLCEAAASLIGARASGLDRAGAQALAEAAGEMLASASAPAPTQWSELGIFHPAREVPSRHKCILLPFRALLAALAAASSTTVGAGDTAPSSAHPP